MENTRFYLRKPNKEGMFSIQLQITINGATITFPTKIKIAQNEWDKKKQCAKRDKEINVKLAKFRRAAMDYSLTIPDNTQPTQDDFTQFINISLGFQKPSTNKSFFGVIDDFISTAPSRRNINGEMICYRSYMKYVYCAQALKDFEKSQRIKLTFTNFNEMVFDDFVSYLLTTKQLANNTAVRYVGCLRVFFRYAQKLKIPTVSEKIFTMKKNKVENVVLDETEMDLVWNFKTKSTMLENIRRMFLFGLYSGLRFSDYSTLSTANIDKERRIITIHQQKTSNKVEIPLHPRLLEMVSQPDFELPHAVTSQVFNRYLKEICKQAGINKMVEIKKIVGGKRVIETHEKWELVSSHTARRSFATALYKKGVNPLVIMSMTGHHTMNDFLKYVVLDNTDNINIVRNIWEAQIV